MVWHYIGVYIPLRLLVKYFSTLEEKFRISARPWNILYISLYPVDGDSFLIPLDLLRATQAMFTLYQVAFALAKKRYTG